MRHGIMTAGIWLCAMSAGATVLVPTDLEELARDAHVIARGQVVGVESQWTEDRRGIETIVTLRTDTYLKGQLGPVLQFSVPGGTLGRLRSLILGAPQFENGQTIVVFLGTNGPRLPHVLGLNQGVYRVSISASGAALVSPPPILPGVTGPVVRGDATRTPRPLVEFERDVRMLSAGAR